MLSGCPGPCAGAECEAAYDASFLALHLGGEGATLGAKDPLAGAVTANGSALQSIDWQVVVSPGALIVGVPALSSVQSLLDIDPEVTQLDALTSGQLEGARSDDRFGAAMVRVPDMDGDGADDLWIGAPAHQGGGNALEAGAAYLFSGLAPGWTDALTPEDARLVLYAEHAYDRLGEVLGGCQDLDGDGLGDLVVSSLWAAGYDEGTTQELSLAGSLAVILSSSLDASAAREEILIGDLGIIWTGVQTGAQLGRSIDCQSDLSGDGLADLFVGAPFVGKGLSSGAGVVYWMDPPSTWEGGAVVGDATRTLPGEDREDHFGAAVASGDLDGDGVPELVVGATGANGGAGEVLIYSGRELRQGATEVTTITGVLDSGHLGASLAVTDLDGDGDGDLIAGAPRSNPFEQNNTFASGILYIFAGGDELLTGPPTFPASEADATYQYAQQFLQVGETLAVGDYDDQPGSDVALLMRIEPNY